MPQIGKVKNKVILVIPAYNEEKTIGNLIKKSRHYCDEILVVSAEKATDNTRKIAKSLGCKVLIDNGKGKGAGMRLAIESVKEGIIVFMDADGSHITSDIPKLTGPIKSGKADMVIGSRFLGGSEEMHGDFDKFLRVFFSMGIALIINWRFRSSIQDTQNGFRAIKADVAKKLDLEANIFDIETEMIMKCLKKKRKILEVPSKELKRKYGKSGIRVFPMGFIYAWRVFKNLF